MFDEVRAVLAMRAFDRAMARLVRDPGMTAEEAEEIKAGILALAPPAEPAEGDPVTGRTVRA
jgi:hypothetical protein